MALEDAETLRTIAEVAIAIAGFSGVVVVFGSRAHGSWSSVEADRLWLLLAQALIVTLFAFLPILLHAGGLGARLLFRVSNGLLVPAVWAIGVQMAFRQRYFERVKEASLLERGFEYSIFAIGGLISTAQLAHAFGLLPARGPFLFLLALLFLLAASITNFWRLLMDVVMAGRR